ncbi:MAG: methylase involved in ubiquinone/menaquinone biosynthesis, partial [halophilic archaeon J07HB67]
MSDTVEELERRPGKSATEIRDAYDDAEADDIESVHWIKRRIGGRARRRQFGDVDGRVLDVACGTGVNFRHLPETTEVVGVDISEDMLEVAREEASELGRDIRLQQMDAQRLSFETDSFDTVVSALSTCTFPDPVEALDEMGRVCEPNGQVRLLEHHKWQVDTLGELQERRAEG